MRNELLISAGWVVIIIIIVLYYRAKIRELARLYELNITLMRMVRDEEQKIYEDAYRKVLEEMEKED